ncbi:asparaginase [Citricoccus sp. SGAir0253]|uniref:asparaginase n=1 Tax=Citricoccus sp. SGAir0253 TaxID=2567881 RepID=UPI0010CD0A9F|nr:asparaginase [Citricoccus sp. SGAir0253]QCU77327.1 asparaginase [Citricoccus sp. SGAir0253]
MSSHTASPQAAPPAPTATFSVPEAVELVHVVRNGFIESRSTGSAVVTAPDGSVLAALGSPGAPVYPRSTLKPLQAIASLRRGARLTDEQVALACGSHRGTARHRATAAAALSAAGLDASFLQCPPAWPADPAGIVQLARDAGPAGPGQTPLAYNCSGKHAGFLSAARHGGHDVHAYLDPDHPVQREVAAVLEQYCGEPVAHWGVDGCGAPAPVLSLAGLARGIGRVAAAPQRRDAEVHAATVATAMLEHPWAVHGETNSNTVVIRELGVLAKLGADGVMAMAAPDGTAVAVKALDGGTRAGNLVALALLAQFAPGQVDLEALPGVLETVVPRILGRGEPVGRVHLARPVLDLLD